MFSWVVVEIFAEADVFKAHGPVKCTGTAVGFSHLKSDEGKGIFSAVVQQMVDEGGGNALSAEAVEHRHVADVPFIKDMEHPHIACHFAVNQRHTEDRVGIAQFIRQSLLAPRVDAPAPPGRKYAPVPSAGFVS